VQSAALELDVVVRMGAMQSQLLWFFGDRSEDAAFGIDSLIRHQRGNPPTGYAPLGPIQ
jgi:hypothetical protein